MDLHVKYVGRIEGCEVEFIKGFEKMEGLRDYLTNLRDFQVTFSEGEDATQYVLHGANAILDKEGNIIKVNAYLTTHEDLQREMLEAQQDLGQAIQGPGGQIIPFPGGDGVA